MMHRYTMHYGARVQAYTRTQSVGTIDTCSTYLVFRCLALILLLVPADQMRPTGRRVRV